jgi:hypothetical protein
MELPGFRPDVEVSVEIARDPDWTSPPADAWPVDFARTGAMEDFAPLPHPGKWACVFFFPE